MDTKEIKAYVYIILLVILIGAIIMYFLISMIRQQRVTLELKKQNMRAELNSIEKERTRIAVDLHDGLAPIVSAIKLKVSSFDLADEVDKYQQQMTYEHLDDLAQRLREISFNLMPVALQRKGLIAALDELASYNSTKRSLRIQVDATPDEILENRHVAIHLYRIVQEIVHNTVKHAEATVLQIALYRNGANLVLETKDDGRGFDFEKLKDGDGYGLRSLLSRADFLGGELSIQSKEGLGTIYSLEIPTPSSPL